VRRIAQLALRRCPATQRRRIPRRQRARRGQAAASGRRRERANLSRCYLCVAATTRVHAAGRERRPRGAPAPARPAHRARVVGARAGRRRSASSARAARTQGPAAKRRCWCRRCEACLDSMIRSCGGTGLGSGTRRRRCRPRPPPPALLGDFSRGLPSRASRDLQHLS
jgi:hypothetical protein